MFQTAEGVKIPFPEIIKEEYQLFEHCLRLNLSFEKIKPMLIEFIEELDEPLFIVLQLPLNQYEEDKLRKLDSEPFHQKVCYLDGQTKDQVINILENYGELILNDGMSQFAITSHVSKDEFFIQKYKLIDIFSKLPSKFIPLVSKYGVTETSDLLTVWDTFAQETPGEIILIKKNSKDIYDVYNELLELGMYDAKIIED